MLSTEMHVKTVAEVLKVLARNHNLPSSTRQRSLLHVILSPPHFLSALK